MSPPLEDPELIEPRPDERLPQDHLEPFLREHLPQAEGELAIAQFGGGHANLTYCICFGDSEYVLRRPPLGPVAPSSHDMRREYRVLSKLYRYFRLAPRSFVYCDDETVIGAPFQVMERRHGTVIRKRTPARYDDPELKRRMGLMVVDVLVEFHRLDRDAVELGELGHPAGFVARQLEGWAKRWEAAKHEDDAEMDRLITWLRDHQPSSRQVSLVHNDYKLDNMIVGPEDPAEAVAILDWDMCTSGDPLLDLGYLLNQWVEPGDNPDWIEYSSMPTAEPGFPTRDDVVQRYAEKSGLDVEGIDWYYGFSIMKFAVIIQQIFIRYHRGQTSDERFAHFDARARGAVEKACAVVGI